MLRRLPVVPTLLVLIAVAVMIRLGFWQISRMHQKEAMLALYANAASMSADAALPPDPAARAKVWFRHTTITCANSSESRPMAGHYQNGQTGWAHWATCHGPDGKPLAEVNLGISTGPQPIPFELGEVRGLIAPDGPQGARVVADQPYPGLQPSARPDPNDIPNNHWSYAIQWFLFAATALAIYALALRKRLAAPPSGG